MVSPCSSEETTNIDSIWLSFYLNDNKLSELSPWWGSLRVSVQGIAYIVSLLVGGGHSLVADKLVGLCQIGSARTRRDESVSRQG